jgi:hypothetical protein
LIGLSLETQIAVEFIRDEEPGTGSGVGVWTALTQGVRLNPGGALRGFDVLGMEDDGSFHSFSCNDLELTFAQKFGIVFNEHGLIDIYVKAVAASDYANEDEAGAEPVPWYPFRVDEYNLDDE